MKRNNKSTKTKQCPPPVNFCHGRKKKETKDDINQQMSNEFLKIKKNHLHTCNILQNTSWWYNQLGIENSRQPPAEGTKLVNAHLTSTLALSLRSPTACMHTPKPFFQRPRIKHCPIFSNLHVHGCGAGHIINAMEGNVAFCYLSHNYYPKIQIKQVLRYQIQTQY